MASDAQLVRTTSQGFQPLRIDDFKRVKNGEVIQVSWTKPRNPLFHRKSFALFNLIFDMLPESEAVAVNYRGERVIPTRDFDHTRKWLIVQAGFYEVFGLPDGSVRVEAKSMSFGSMEEAEFERLYSALIGVALKVIPIEMTELEMRHAVDEILRFE